MYAKKFEAILTVNPYSVFNVSPASGLLQPVSAGGTAIFITFTPPYYGSVFEGELVVKSEGMVWKYALQGCPPS